MKKKILSFICLVLMVVASTGNLRSADKVGEKLEKAKGLYEKEMKKIETDAKKYFEAEEKKWRSAANKKKVDEILDQRRAFETDGSLPNTAPSLLRKNLVRQREILEKSYQEAIGQYTKAKMDEHASTAEKELKELLTKNAIVEPKDLGGNANVFRTERKCAEKLIDYFTLTLIMSDGSEINIDSGSQLPNMPFVIMGVVSVVPTRQLNPKFVDETFLPIVANLNHLRRIWPSGPASFLPISDEQLEALAKLPAVKTLDSLVCELGLSNKTINSLKKFGHLKQLGCGAAAADDAVLAKLNELQSLQELTLIDLGKIGTVTKMGLDKITSMPLSRLELKSSPAISRNFFQNLQKMPRLYFVDFGESPVENEHLKELAKCQTLGIVYLYGNTKITDDGIVHLTGVRNLNSLHIGFNSNISDAALLHMDKIANLNQLRVESTRISDAGMMHLSKCQRLTDLWAPNTQITDAGLNQIAKIKSLKKVTLRGTKVTEGGGKLLAKVRPDLTIYLDSGTIEAKK
ncbi:hypothetical protein [Fimbriiglobus ruber]|uniref:Rab family protein n=1 Tax=Fimbriiglobus ruber TaxID=1908690 RepID=A0A225DV91_9BACT|nr:hypothetical protein [Fimbriiglobus ruber]OWK43574.1 Rab family protein [Fimbriiglobus ruber]